MRTLIFKIFFFFLCLTFLVNVFSQSTIQLKFSPIGIHPFNETNKHLFDNKIDENAIFVTEPLFLLCYESYLREDSFAFRGMFGFLNDAAAKPAITLHLGLKQRLVQIWRNSFSVGAGFNLYGRGLWSTIPGYIQEKHWGANGTWEYKLGFMGELEYALFLNDKNDLTLSLLYGHQQNTFTVTIGYKYWISSIIKHPKKCGNCPFQKTSKHWNP